MAEAERDTAAQQICVLSKSLEEDEKNFAEAIKAVGQIEPLQSEVAELEKTVERILTERDEARRKRDEALSASQIIAVKALTFGDEAFKNALEQVAVLNPGISHRTREANVVWNVFGAVLVEYNADKSSHEVRFVLDALGAPEVINAPNT